MMKFSAVQRATPAVLAREESFPAFGCETVRRQSGRLDVLLDDRQGCPAAGGGEAVVDLDHDLFQAEQFVGEHAPPVLRCEEHVGMEAVDHVAASSTNGISLAVTWVTR
ncbi:hypothetical protein [Nonomuraea polychroma]|uniref:hypothetical protein n=1 Tax=Nonomuraea polychroma TaxID=46176 RepID=UPI0013E3D8CA